MITISNNELRVVISTLGAEVQNITDVATGREYLWQGDERWWRGRSPILFPIVGGMWNGTCRIAGQEISIPKHGVVRRAEWSVAEKGQDYVSLQIFSTVGSFAIFPFAFRLQVTYRLEERKLCANFHVDNLSACDLWFQLGGHPAIALPDWSEANAVDGYLDLEGNAKYVLRAGEQGCLENEKFPVPAEVDGLVPLSVETFSHEALIFDEHQVSAVRVLNRNKQAIARVESSAPVWLFWSPKGVHTPFVCCEPWYGLCDHQGFTGTVEERPYIQCVHEGESWEGFYSVEVF